MNKHVQVFVTLAGLGLAASLASCGGGEDIYLPDPCLDLGICDDEMDITPDDAMSWSTCIDRHSFNYRCSGAYPSAPDCRRESQNTCFETQRSSAALSSAGYQCLSGRICDRSRRRTDGEIHFSGTPAPIIRETSCTVRDFIYYLGARVQDRSPAAEQFRRGCRDNRGVLRGLSENPWAGSGTGTGTGSGTGGGGTGSGGGANCSSIEAALQGWRGDPTDHARFHCAAACVPGQTRTANCQILRGYRYPGGAPGQAERQCSYCGG
ncbi:MAG: hypothetical protein F4X97_07065 [Boseongicola sp. SB0662_bin_57]|nr:hypothetical protein [Gammaproteobacteria bacterium]MYA88199.1 hypothetical protein [Boseongicola sp. SB0662_bin_57]